MCASIHNPLVCELCLLVEGVKSVEYIFRSSFDLLSDEKKELKFRESGTDSTKSFEIDMISSVPNGKSTTRFEIKAQISELWNLNFKDLKEQIFYTDEAYR